MQGAFFIESDGAVNHTPGFAKAAGTVDSFLRAIDCAKGLAAVGVDVLTNSQLANEMLGLHMSDISSKATAEFGKEVPSQEQIDKLLESPSHPLEKVFKIPGFPKDQAIAALMAVDIYLDKKRGLF
jgi:hypothetical protein